MAEGYIRNHNHTLHFVAPADIMAGKVHQVAGVSGIVMGAGMIKSGEEAELAVDIVADVATASGTTFSEGAAVQWDDTAKLAVAVGDFPLGIAEKAKGAGELKTRVIFNKVATA